MTFVHFLNCLALAYAPYVVVYKSSILSEYNTLGKIAVAGLVYMLTQLAKMLVLATFFPSIEPNGIGGTSLFAEVVKTTVDIADLVGIYYIIKQTMGKSELKVLVAGIGWSGAHVLFTNILSFWFGARGLEFDWKYIQTAFDANVTMVHVISMAALVWIWSRNDLNRTFVPMIAVLLFLAVYRTVILEVIAQIFSVNAWMFLLSKIMVLDAETLALVEREGFKTLMAVVAPCYSLSSRPYLLQTALPNLKTKVKEKLEKYYTTLNFWPLLRTYVLIPITMLHLYV